MESRTAVPAHGGRPGRSRSRTSAWPPSGTASSPAARYKRDGEWTRRQLRELGEIVSEIGPRADRSRHRARRPRRAAVHDAAGVDVRGLRDHVRRRRRRPDLPDELARGVRSGSRATPSRARSSARTPRRWRRSSPSAGDLPELETIIVVDPGGDAATRSRSTTLRERGRGARRGRAGRARRGRSRPRTRTRSSTRRARPGRRRAACSRHGNYRTSSRCASATRSSRPATPSTCSSRSRTRSRC